MKEVRTGIRRQRAAGRAVASGRADWGRAPFLRALVFAFCLAAPPAHGLLLDDFEELSGWGAITSEGASVTIVQDAGHSGRGMRLDFDFHGAGGYVNVQKTFSLPLPENYSFSFRIRGEAPANNFEFKLIDPSGQNVWWRNQRGFDFPGDWKKMTIKKSRIEFAWGPSSGSVLNHVGSIEFTVAAGNGGKGSIWIDELELEEREPANGWEANPAISASSSVAGHDPRLAMDGDATTAWRSASGEHQWLLIDFQRPHEYGGLVIDWDEHDYAGAYQVQISTDGTEWATPHTSVASNGGRDYIYMPEAESRYVRLVLQRSSRQQGYAIRSIAVKPFGFSASPNQFFEAMARDAEPGSYPKYLLGRQTYWTVIGVDGDGKEALLNDDGMLEVEQGSFSLEPFVELDGNLLTWASVETEQSLLDGYLPIPSVTWTHEAISLQVTAFASGKPDVSTLYVRYRIENRSDQPRQIRLFVAVRPFQVNPPWQSLKSVGGAMTIRDIRYEGRAAWVNGEKAVASLTPPDAFGAATFEQGDVTSFLRAGRLPTAHQVADPFGHASGIFAYDLEIDPSAHRDVHLLVPFHYPNIIVEAASRVVDPAPAFEERLEDAAAAWRMILNRVDIQLPPERAEVVMALRTVLGHILINRDGTAIQPGSRAYGRSWIRDGALTATALLEMGFTEEARDFLEWFVQYQYPSGKVPCCVDERGADPTPEHDSQGELIYAIAEYYRYTRDVGFLTQMWPHVVRAVEHMSELRAQRLTEPYLNGEGELFRGLMPPSISHEGYASHPVHSYWDDFFALLGFKDAASLSLVMDEDGQADRFASLRDSFRSDLLASIARAMAKHGIDYIPGSADLGDFDATSTAIALAPCGERESLPEPALTRTFDRYLRYFAARRDGSIEWEAYTPYEFRNVAALVRMGQPEQAFEVFEYLFADRRPVAWNQWPEIVWRDPEAPRFIGDLPHTWVGSSFILALRSMFAYERASDRALVIGAGLPREWLDGRGVAARRLPTQYGPLSYTSRLDGPDTLRLKLTGDLNVPPGNIIVASPLERPIRAVEVNGEPVSAFDARRAIIGTFPAEVVLHYEPVESTPPAEPEGVPPVAER